MNTYRAVREQVLVTLFQGLTPIPLFCYSPIMWQYIIAALYRVLQQHFSLLTLTLLTWRIGWAPNNASRWQMGFNSAFKGLIKEMKLLYLQKLKIWLRIEYQLLFCILCFVSVFWIAKKRVYGVMFRNKTLLSYV